MDKQATIRKTLSYLVMMDITRRAMSNSGKINNTSVVKTGNIIFNETTDVMSKEK